MTPRLHTWAWIAWLASTVVFISRTRNPLYLTLVFLVIFILAIRLNRLLGNQKPVLFIRLALSLILFSAVLNALFAHVGSTVLFRLPDSLPILGGVVTLEGFIYGAINGLVLACLFGAFSIVSTALPARAIIGLVPKAYYPAAVVLSIAMTFIPSALRQFNQIREAQAVRGHRMQGIRDWLPLAMPLLIGGLERAFNLSESMTARGFSYQVTNQPAVRKPLVGLISLAILLAGWFLWMQPEYRLAGAGLMTAGSVLIIWLIWRSGQSIPATTYRQEHWAAIDSLVVLCATFPWIAVLLLAGGNTDSLSYTPYPLLTLPEFNSWIGLGILGLLGPLFCMRNTTESGNNQ